MSKINSRILGPLLAAALFGAALWVLHRSLGAFHYQDIVRQLHSVPAGSLIMALVLTGCSYLVLTTYDLLAVRYIKHKLAVPKVMLASFASYALSNNIGLSLLMAGSVRYRFYSTWGLSAEEILRLVGFTVVTFWMGLLTVGGGVFVFSSLSLSEVSGLAFISVHALGWIFLAMVFSYLLVLKVRKAPLRLRSWTFSLPSLPLGGAQLVIGTLDWILAGSVLYVLIPPSSTVTFVQFLGVYLLAQIVALISHVPGGLGVFESVILLFLPGIHAAALLGSLLLYRGIYYLLPLALATLALVGTEMHTRRRVVSRLVKAAGQWGGLMVPQLLALSTFIAGAILLFSGATPAEPQRLHWLKEFLPLPVMEISHFLGSLIGAVLLLLARGIQRRLDAAYLLTAGLLAAGSVFSLLKGVDYEEALVLGGMLLALLPCHRHFYRKSSLLGESFSLEWIVTILIVFSCSAWLGFFAYKHVAYSHELWWHFSIHGDAPRFLRAVVGVGAFLLLFGLLRLLKPAKVEPQLPDTAGLEQARQIIGSVSETAANLALLGDKALLFSAQRDGFVMYGIEKRSWIALGDPVGPLEVARDLAWQFRELVEQNGGQTIFYEVGPKLMHIYLDMGLMLFKLGETARVPLADFSLEGKKRSTLRYTKRHLEKEEYCFEVIPAPPTAALLAEVKAVSDAWLGTKNVREKGFSLGFFDTSYLANFPLAVVRRHDEIIAFANLWAGSDQEELSIDLMRFRPESPSGIMDFLFVNLLLWGQEQGYRFFDLGMAPLSGMENRPFAPVWHRIGAFVFRQGEHFYNFEGLRAYKQKFNPNWEPRYLACPGGLALPHVLLNVSTLISGGIKGLIGR